MGDWVVGELGRGAAAGHEGSAQGDEQRDRGGGERAGQTVPGPGPLLGADRPQRALEDEVRGVRRGLVEELRGELVERDEGVADGRPFCAALRAAGEVGFHGARLGVGQQPEYVVGHRDRVVHHEVGHRPSPGASALRSAQMA